MISAVLFDLDDTLFPQASWLDGAWRAVASAGAAAGVDERALLTALLDVAGEGSARGRIIDRALARCGADAVDVAPLVAAFLAFESPPIAPYDGAVAGLDLLRAAGLRLGLVTDGDPDVQRSKLRSVGLADAFDVVVLSDEIGRAYRKPDPAPFLAALAALAVDPEEAVMVGDRPEKDVAGAHAIGMRAVRVRTGEYGALPDDPAPWRSVATVADAIDAIVREARGGPSGARPAAPRSPACTATPER